AGSWANAMMRARVRRLRSSMSPTRVSSRICGVSAPTRATSLGTDATRSSRFFQNSIAAVSSTPRRCARPSSTGRVSFLPPNSPMVSSFLDPDPSLSYRLGEIPHDLFQTGSGREDAPDTGLLQTRDIGLGDDPTAKEQDIVHALLPHQLGDARKDVVVRA